LQPAPSLFPSLNKELTEKNVSDRVANWGGENVTDRITECDPVFVLPHFFDLKINHLQNAGKQK